MTPITPELSLLLQRIDDCKARINQHPYAPKVLAILEREFVVGAVYHGMRLSGGELSRNEVRDVLIPLTYREYVFHIGG